MEKHFTYNAEFKKKVILCAKQIKNYAARKKYTVSERNVCCWRVWKPSCLLQDKYKVIFWPKKRKTPDTNAAILKHFRVTK
jgi:hypothetical protein